MRISRTTLLLVSITFGLLAGLSIRSASIAPQTAEASVGFTATKTEIDSTAGQIARDLKRALERARDFDDFLDAKVDADLVALGYTSAEVADLKSALNDADQLYTIYNGTATLGTAKDFKTFLSRLWGLGGIY